MKLLLVGIFIHYLSEYNKAEPLKYFPLLPFAKTNIRWDCSFESKWIFSQLWNVRKEEEMREKGKEKEKQESLTLY